MLKKSGGKYTTSATKFKFIKTLVSTSNKIVSLIQDTPMPAVEKYLKSCVFKDLAEFEGVLINYEDIKIK